MTRRYDIRRKTYSKRSRYLAKGAWYTADFGRVVPKDDPEAKHWCGSKVEAEAGRLLLQQCGAEALEHQPKPFDFAEKYHAKYGKYLRAHTRYRPDYGIRLSCGCRHAIEVKNGNYDYPGALRKIELFLEFYPEIKLKIYTPKRGFEPARDYLDYARKRDKEKREKKRKLAAMRKMAEEQRRNQ